ncbi:hypothetical protein GOBAR_AA33626 [Gossypium barbadense]|uniref:SWIM-type domain-containing protein n=1 Tax=Gossypium barbadense TaxID=3634 RepID=A0A2P5W7J0_GOSBA|nr:hypothetical protein GOBAR_AA33626 [Gossypium barbadense]
MHLSWSMFDAGNTYWGMTSINSGWQSTSDWRRCETSIRRDDVLPTTSTGEGTFYVAHDDGSDNESDADPPREADPDGAEVALFSKPEPVPNILEDVEWGSNNEEEDPRFKAYSPPAHMHNVDLSEDDALGFSDLPHRRRDRTSSSLDSGELKVGKEFSNKDIFLVQDSTSSWKVIASLRKKTGLWEIKKYKGPHTCAASVSEDHPKMNSDMLATLILPTVKADPKISVSILIANIRSQLRYTPSYHKAWIAKQKALEKIHGGWDASYNKVWQWCQVLERYVPGCVTNLETEPAYYNDRLLHGCQGHKHTTVAYDMVINSVLKGTCHLPITSVARETYFSLAVLFLKRAASYKGQMQGGHVWCAKVLQEINKAKAWANTIHTVCHDRDNLWFRVTEFDRPHEGIIGRQYRVHLRNRTCDCGRFDALHYPCAHVIAAC